MVPVPTHAANRTPGGVHHHGVPVRSAFPRKIISGTLNGAARKVQSLFVLLEHAHQSGVGFGADGLDAGIGQSPAVRTGTQGQVRGAFHGAVLKEPLHFSPGSGFGAGLLGESPRRKPQVGIGMPGGPFFGLTLKGVPFVEEEGVEAGLFQGPVLARPSRPTQRLRVEFRPLGWRWEWGIFPRIHIGRIEKN